MKGIGKKFIEYTKPENLELSNEDKGLPEPPIEKEIKNPESLIDLPQISQVEKSIELSEAINQRKSIRKFSDKPINLAQLGFLLWHTQGIQKMSAYQSASKRTVPSAGARHPLETYIISTNVCGLDSWVYRYLASKHQLYPWMPQHIPGSDIIKACLGQDFVTQGAAVFVWSAVIERMTWRYGERGYRYIFLDAGHACQNLYLAAASLNCGVCAIGAYWDDKINKVVNIDGEDEFVVYMAVVGKPIS